jgi:hypothetical protein
MSSSYCISVTQAPKVERWGCGVRELSANPPKPASIPCPIVAFATETASSYPNPVEESYKVDQVFCNLVDQYSEEPRAQVCIPKLREAAAIAFLPMQ